MIIDSADLDSESAFWHDLLGGSLAKAPTHHFLHADGLPASAVQRALGHVPPHWPDGNAQQMHFDLATGDLAAADQQVLAAGGRRLRPTDDVTDPDAKGSRVYASPAGHPFCVRTA
ncbi:VOC family protein [Streptomyces sp. NBC_01445]|uniref:VOC family protein n=1 Tax=Streptomyces sp. NBC_01445 TaxID=2903869 RepID=UPI002DDAB192|nr:VOC family protein [Streptomyces sp. NBC_01445]WSE10386.1 VOC family protein [Streptomyces sp. NBC_01445]